MTGKPRLDVGEILARQADPVDRHDRLRRQGRAVDAAPSLSRHRPRVLPRAPRRRQHRRRAVLQEGRDERGVRSGARRARRGLRRVHARRRSSRSPGDIGRPLCNFTDEQLAEVAVDVIINSAGLVSFAPSLESAIRINALGAKNVLDLARKLGARLVHVSTCYVAGQREGDVWEDEPVVGYFPRSSSITRDWDTQNELLDRDFDPAAEIADCQKMIDQARERSNDRQHISRVPRAGCTIAARSAPRSRRRRRSQDRRRARAQDLAQQGAHRSRPRARAPLGLDQHVHVYEEPRRADHPVRSHGRLDDRAAGGRREQRALSVPGLERRLQHDRAADVLDPEGPPQRARRRRRRARRDPGRLRRPPACCSRPPPCSPASTSRSIRSAPATRIGSEPPARPAHRARRAPASPRRGRRARLAAARAARGAAGDLRAVLAAIGADVEEGRRLADPRHRRQAADMGRAQGRSHRRARARRAPEGLDVHRPGPGARSICSSRSRPITTSRFAAITCARCGRASRRPIKTSCCGRRICSTGARTGSTRTSPACRNGRSTSSTKNSARSRRASTRTKSSSRCSRRRSSCIATGRRCACSIAIGDPTAYSYGQLGELGWMGAGVLRQLGVGAGARVALMSENRPEWGISFFAIVLAGRRVRAARQGADARRGREPRCGRRARASSCCRRRSPSGSPARPTSRSRSSDDEDARSCGRRRIRRSPNTSAH